jgi:hypothetical protein
VKNLGPQLLREEARSFVRQIERVKFEHVRRSFNEDADRWRTKRWTRRRVYARQ